MEKKDTENDKLVAKLPIWLLRGTAVSALSAVIFFFVTGYTIKIEPNCAEATCVALTQTPGLVGGGGTMGNGNCWGVATCSQGYFNCASGYSKVFTGTSSILPFYLCIRQ